MEFSIQASGKVRAVFGQVWASFGQSLGKVWASSGKVRVKIGQSLGKVWAKFGQSLGKFRAKFRQSFGKFHLVDHFWPLFVFGYHWLPLATIDLVGDNREFEV